MNNQFVNVIYFIMTLDRNGVMIASSQRKVGAGSVYCGGEFNVQYLNVYFQSTTFELHTT